MFNEGAGDRNTNNLFTARDFGFGDNDDTDEVVNLDNANEQTDQVEDPETLDNVRRAALTPPRGLFGGSPLLDDSLHLYYEDTPLVNESCTDETENESSTPTTRRKAKRK